jgi:hypothetical protein
MRDLIILLVHVVTTVMRVFQPGGVRAVIAESVLAKHQLLILNRPRRRVPNLRIRDRLIAGFCSLWIRPKRHRRLAIAFKPSTFLNFHRAMVQRKYRLLFSPKQRRKPGSEGADGGFDPSRRRDEAAQSVVGMSADRSADQFSFRNIY